MAMGKWKVFMAQRGRMGGKKKYVRPTRKTKRLKNIVKNTVRNMSELKKFEYYLGTYGGNDHYTAMTLTHTDFSEWNVSFTEQGTTDSKRVGDKIFIEGILVDGILEWKTAVGDTQPVNLPLWVACWQQRGKTTTTPLDTIGWDLDAYKLDTENLSIYKRKFMEKWIVPEQSTPLPGALAIGESFSVYRHVRMYIPIKKYITYSDAGTLADDPIFISWGAADDGVTSTKTNNKLTHGVGFKTGHFVTYFRDI